MKYVFCFSVFLALSACASSPAPFAGFVCKEVTPVESTVAGHRMTQFPCTRWERKADEIPKKPDSIWYKDIG